MRGEVEHGFAADAGGVDGLGGTPLAPKAARVGLLPHARHRMSPLHVCAQENWAAAARVLLAAGADAALPDGHGATSALAVVPPWSFHHT